MPDKQKPKPGRPPKPLDLEELKRWARTGATQQEIAPRLGMSEDTLGASATRPGSACLGGRSPG
jgi:hypothetical protein